MKKIRPLSTLSVGETATVEHLYTKGSMRRRLQDSGLVDGTRIECVLKSAGGDPAAYLIRGAVIAIRCEDSSTVMVCD